jgi:hypothetical protein
MLAHNTSESEFEDRSTIFTKPKNQIFPNLRLATADQLKPAFAFVFLKNTIRNLSSLT